MNAQNVNKPIIVTGLSGAGLSSVLKNLEDLGFEVFDNFPLALIPPLKEESKDLSNVAIGIDTRTRGFSPQAVLETAKELNAFLVFITCDDDVLHKRFSETRRRHPLTKDEPLSEGIAKERALLAQFIDKADLTIDTTRMSIHDLRHILEGHFGDRSAQKLTITLMSFGFKHGSPREADILIDVRFLRNPHWDKDLKPKTGLDEDVGAYIREDEEYEGFINRFQDMLLPLLPRYKEEGKSYLSVAIGCTGGRHRSVYIVEQLGKWLQSQNIQAHIEHRDLKG